ncbi:NADPH:quinone reductase-like Zn-dependent oxidoreductase [Pedobacter cryoconitis]|uniref:NADP-dependent oxidoreductase n=1 Tax=Pedobacter cryoconitis TaxID=188932 RepID=UPI001616C602|nr:NADP-dependent oxidoreductase [Pedobacter cryoconitis]MBB6272362.1 NADPH:quinone reductase-like Zn-dependent oxidoreductase [Pedobacter cryoconitis]
MKAYLLKEPGSTENLILTELPIPVPADHEVLIKVKAISINPVDVKTRAGKALYSTLQHLKPFILGWDISGTVIATGKDVVNFQIDDDVFGMVNFVGHGQAYAAYVAAPENHLALKPSNISFEEAAAATLAALTAWQALTTHVNVKPADKILIHAASGGVGHYAVQIAHYLGAHVTGTSSATNKNFVLELGADVHIDYNQQKFEERTNGFDIILETIGGENFIRSLDILNEKGTIINLIPDQEPEGPAGSTPQKSTLELAGERGLNALYFPVTSNGSDMHQIAILLEKGILRSHIFKTYSFEALPEAHLQIESGRTAGKVIVLI